MSMTQVLQQGRTQRTSVGRDDVPRYLFRAYSNKSFGYNDSTEMIPTAFNEGVGHKSIFHVPEQERQKMLSDHLAWSRDTCSDFLSWSSSLLFVLIHGVRRKYYQKEEGVNICIMDTHEAKDNDVYPARMLVKLWGVDKPDDWYQSEYLVHGPLGSKRGAVYTTVPLDFFEGHGLYQLFPELYEGRESFELLKRVNRLRGTFSVLEDTPIDEVMVLIKTLTSSLLSTSAFSVPLAIAFLKLGARKHDDASLNQMIRHFSPFNFPSWMEIPREVARASALYEGACGLTEVSGFAKLLQAISIRRMAATIAQSTFTVESGQYPQPEVQGEFEALGQKQAGIGSGDQLIFKFEGLKVFDGEASKPLSSSDEASATTQPSKTEKANTGSADDSNTHATDAGTSSSAPDHAGDRSQAASSEVVVAKTDKEPKTSYVGFVEDDDEPISSTDDRAEVGHKQPIG